ncbi:MAG: glycosyltransferase, partial [Actinomycetota bacterium]|nr:glycosyltransferase [Actinomycetota bacterium]
PLTPAKGTPDRWKTSFRPPELSIRSGRSDFPEPHFLPAHLGPRFRFLHVEGLTGAKAGALNCALGHTDPAAELVAVVDADYQVEPDFLIATVAYFNDPATGFVQSPHAYRDWESSTYLTMCRWEYAHFFATQLVSRNERVAALTVGTMCVIRRQALERAGGWAEWCLTEDSELAVRIHALGYTSVYLTEVYGRGLIPDTFAGYKTQRFRWTYGPVQELRRHFRLFLPRRWRQASELSVAQRLHHATHGIGRANMGLGLAAMPWGATTAASMVAHGEVVAVARPLWFAATAVLVGGMTLRWLSYRVLLGARLRHTLGAIVASAALAHTVGVAALFGVLGREVPWRRTDKFRRPGRGIRALRAVRTEAVLAGGCFVFATVGFAAMPGTGVATMLLVGIALHGLIYAAGVVMTLLGERDLRRVVPPPADKVIPMGTRDADPLARALGAAEG